MSTAMNSLAIRIFKSLPVFTLFYSFWVLFVCLGILHDNKDNIFFFIFLSFQVYVNWITIVCISCNCVYISKLSHNDDNVTLGLLNNEVTSWKDATPFNYEGAQKNELYPMKLLKQCNERFASSVDEDFQEDLSTLWYCPKCCQQTLQMCYHCPICNKCVAERDHHCFFIGSCITSQNMKHFIVLLFYTTMTSFYAVYLLSEEMTLFQAVSNDWTLIHRHFLPVAFALYLGGSMILHNMLRIALLNTVTCMAIFSLAFFVYNLYLVFSGKMLLKLQGKHIIRSRSVGSKTLSDNFSLLFGRFGVLNFLMPVGFARNVLKIHLQ